MRRVVTSACQGCLSNCPVQVTIEDERAVRVRGNAASTATGGGVCPALAITLEQEYDPDRVAMPLRRRNPRKGRGVDPQFEPVTWDEALDEIADRMMALREAGHPERLALAKGRSTGISEVLTRVLPEIYGTPNSFNHDSICADAEKLATGAMDGVYDYHDYDWEHLECAILWGADPIASNRQKAYARRALPEALRRGVPVFVVDPRRSMTAELVEREARRKGSASAGDSNGLTASDAGGSGLCDLSPRDSAAHVSGLRVYPAAEPSDAGCWVPVVPGTDGALASAIARVILVEGLWNRDYVGDFKDGENLFAEAAQLKGAVDEAFFQERFTHGVCAWWNEELFDKTPEWAEAETGVPASLIVRMARTFARAGQRSVSWISPGVAMSARGLYSGMACYALNGLVGSIGAEGGVLAFPSLPVKKLPSTEPYRDGAARRACSSPRVDIPQRADFLCAKAGRAHRAPVTNLIPEAIEGGRVDMLVAYWCNYPFSCTGASRWERALDAHANETPMARRRAARTFPFGRDDLVVVASSRNAPFKVARGNMPIRPMSLPIALHNHARKHTVPCLCAHDNRALGRRHAHRVTRPKAKALHIDRVDFHHVVPWFIPWVKPLQLVIQRGVRRTALQVRNRTVLGENEGEFTLISLSNRRFIMRHKAFAPARLVPEQCRRIGWVHPVAKRMVLEGTAERTAFELKAPRWRGKRRRGLAHAPALNGARLPDALREKVPPGAF